MRTLFIIAFTFFASSTFAQQDMFWNNYSNYNPAMSGFQYQQHAAISYSDYFQNYRPRNIQANYNIRLGDKHGLGLNHSTRLFFLNSTSTTINYNYQFDLKRAGKLSAGVGAGINTLNDNPNMDSYYSFSFSDPLVHFQLNLGVAYKWKGLLTGFSVQNIAQPRAQTYPGFLVNTKPVYTAHAEYNFSLGKLFQLTPRAIYNLSYGNIRLNTDLTLTFKNKFSLGAMYDVGNSVGFHAGWDIKEKFRVAYLFNSRLSQLNSNSPLNARHQITLGFKL